MYRKIYTQRHGKHWEKQEKVKAKGERGKAKRANFACILLAQKS